MSVPQLRVVDSVGPREYQEPDTGAWVEYSTPCPACDGAILPGDQITYTGGEWAHAKCVTDWVVTEKARTAWLVLGSQLARRPRQFSAKETTAVVNQLLRLAGGLPPAPWQPDHPSYDGEG